MNGYELFSGLVFGSIGVGYVIYGRRQRVLTPFVAGLGLIAFPYLVSGTFATLAVGTVLILLPVIVHRLERG
jgi:hypothetical protein